MAACYNSFTKQVNGGYLQEVWFEGTSSEVHFKGKNISLYPWGEYSNWPPPNGPWPYQNCWVDVVELCHVTHRQQFYQIRQPRDGTYVLKPLQKMGKEGYHRDGYLLGATYTPIGKRYPLSRYSQYRQIQNDEPVLPGYYIWWSINRKYNKELDDDDDFEVSDLFSEPPTSVYGSKKISIMSYHLFRSYQDAYYNGRNYPKIEFRNGGTLRYKHEICYVIIVCAQGCFTGPSAEQYPPIPVFNIKYNIQNGRISFVEKWRVKIRNAIGSIHGQSISWDHYVFAFHYPNDSYRMVLAGGNTAVQDVFHDFCIKKLPVDGELVCPDKL